jgi:PAS domain S-box-containing protein
MGLLDRFRKNDDAQAQAEYLKLVPTPVMAVDREMNVVYMNPAGATVTGVSPEECLGRKCYTLFQTDHCQTARCAVRRAMLEDAKVEERTVSHARGQNIPIQYVGRPVKDDAGNIIGAIEYVADMSATYRVVDQVKEVSVGLAGASKQLSSAADQSAQAANQVAAVIQQVASSAAQQTESVTSATTTVEQVTRAIGGVARGAQEQAAVIGQSVDITASISTTVRHVAVNAQAGAQSAIEAAQSAHTGAQTVKKTIKGMENIKDKVTLSAQKVREMGQRSEQIGVIVDTIDDIASQTNLLALNAAIEAARAGEHGKGFAVVADEVRKLAENSAAATREIAGLIKEVQRTVSEAVRAMEEGATEVEAGVIQSDEAGQTLDTILVAAEAVSRQVEEIATSALQMDTSVNQLVNAMDNVSAVVEENTAATEEMAAGANEVSRVMEDITSTAEENSAASEEVSASVVVAQFERTGGRVQREAEWTTVSMVPAATGEGDGRQRRDPSTTYKAWS